MLGVFQRRALLLPLLQVGQHVARVGVASVAVPRLRAQRGGEVFLERKNAEMCLLEGGDIGGIGRIGGIGGIARVRALGTRGMWNRAQAFN